MSSGTAAIHLSLILLGVKPGDYVIGTSFTFSATVNPIAYLGATPVLVDSERDTWNMDPELLEEALKGLRSEGLKSEGQGKMPKAIVVAHLYGMPAKMKEIMAVADRYGIPVVEDAAEALGSCLLYTSDAADDLLCVDLGGRRTLKQNTMTLTTG